MRTALPAQRPAELGSKIAEGKKPAPTRPHPHTPPSQGLPQAAGPVADAPALATRRLPSDWQRSVGVLITIIIGTVLGTLAATQSPSWVPAAVIMPEATVLACSLRIARSPIRRQPARRRVTP